MTTIHHATQKKADKEGVKLMTTGTGADTLVTAIAGSNRINHPKAKIALEAAILGRTLDAEYPALRLVQIDVDAVKQFAVQTGQGNDAQNILGPQSEVPTLADVLDACSEHGVDPEEGLDEIEAEEEERRIVVAPKYKEAYRERGNPDHCGDWLAGLLDGQFTSTGIKQDREGENVKADVFDHEAFLQFLIDNGVDVSGKWTDLPNSGQRGWQGRFRMNGRQKLEPLVALNGEVKLGGKRIPVPEDELANLRAKHARFIEKQAA